MITISLPYMYVLIDIHLTLYKCMACLRVNLITNTIVRASISTLLPRSITYKSVIILSAHLE